MVTRGYSLYCNEIYTNSRANGAKRRSGRKPGARVTNSALAEFKVVAHGRWYVLTDLNNMADYRVE